MLQTDFLFFFGHIYFLADTSPSNKLNSECSCVLPSLHPLIKKKKKKKVLHLPKPFIYSLQVISLPVQEIILTLTQKGVWKETGNRRKGVIATEAHHRNKEGKSMTEMQQRKETKTGQITCMKAHGNVVNWDSKKKEVFLYNLH